MRNIALLGLTLILVACNESDADQGTQTYTIKTPDGEAKITAGKKGFEMLQNGQRITADREGYALKGKDGKTIWGMQKGKPADIERFAGLIYPGAAPKTDAFFSMGGDGNRSHTGVFTTKDGFDAVVKYYNDNLKTPRPGAVMNDRCYFSGPHPKKGEFTLTVTKRADHTEVGINITKQD